MNTHRIHVVVNHSRDSHDQPETSKTNVSEEREDDTGPEVSAQISDCPAVLFCPVLRFVDDN